MLFWQVQKHQRSHKREATKSAPYKRTTPEDHQAMEGAGVEGYRPEEWEPEETRQLDELVNQLGVCISYFLELPNQSMSALFRKPSRLVCPRQSADSRIMVASHILYIPSECWVTLSALTDHGLIRMHRFFLLVTSPFCMYSCKSLYD